MERTGTFEYKTFRVEPRCKLGEGAFGEVVLGVNKKNKSLVAAKKVAIKTHEMVAAVMKEIMALRQLPEHDHVVHLLTSFFDSKATAHWLIFEYCDMGDLEAFFKKYKPGPFTTVEIMYQVTKGLAFMHGLPKKIMHRDLKPQNVMMTFLDRPRPIAKVADFGLAKVQEEQTGRSLAQTFMANTACGTMCFLAPEVLRRDTYGTAVDVFSAGLLFLGLISFKHKGDIFPLADYDGVPAAFRSSPIGVMLMACKEMGTKTPDFCKSHPEDPPIFVEVKKVVRSMVCTEASDRITSQRVEAEMKTLYDSIRDKLENPPPKPSIRLPTSLADVLGDEKPRRREKLDDSEEMGYGLVEQLLRQLVIAEEDKGEERKKESGGRREQGELSVEAMPLLAALEQMQRALFHVEGPFKVGERVRVACRSKDRAIEMQENYGGWNPKMEKHLGQAGKVVSLPLHVVKVVFSNGDTFSWNPELLESMESPAEAQRPKSSREGEAPARFKKGQIVRVTTDEDEAKRLQKNHGGWNKLMTLSLGLRGIVQGTDRDGDVLVLTFIVKRPWIWHPDALKIESAEDDEFGSGDIVVIMDDQRKLERLQDSAGGWIDEMEAAVGKTGVVKKVSAQSILVEVVGTKFFFHPSALTLLAKSTEVVATLMKKKLLRL